MPALLEPSWWYAPERRWQATALRPVAAVVGALAVRRYRRGRHYRCRLPVICVGNFTAGGSGKTPFALALADTVRQLGREPWFLSRGYGGRLAGPVLVSGAHTSGDVGDEPLLLAVRAQTVVARDRAEGAQFIEARAPDDAVIIMDDGLQNPSLVKDLAIAVVDRRRGVGNGLVIPAGPLRAPLRFQAGLVDLVAASGPEGASDIDTGAGRDAGRDLAETLGEIGAPVVRATTIGARSNGWVGGQRVLAYAGIANPQRFFDLVLSSGGVLAETRVFADHHAYGEADARALLAGARAQRAQLVTTEKDLVRLAAGSGAIGDLKDASRTLGIEATFDAASRALLVAALEGVLRR